MEMMPTKTPQTKSPIQVQAYSLLLDQPCGIGMGA